MDMNAAPDPFFISAQIGLSGQLAVYDWPAPEGPPRGRVLLVHGLGEHMGRYTHVAEQLRTWGFAVRGYDHYGHGRSAGLRGDMVDARCLMGDLACMIDVTRQLSLAQDKPLILLGHSLGGLIAANAVATQLRPVDALVLSSPALATSANIMQKMLLALLPKLAPHLCVDNGLKAHFVARDPQVVQAYLADPLVHRRISAGLAQWIVQQGPLTLAQAAHWQAPTLLMYAQADRLVDPAGSAQFARQAPACVASRSFDGMYHEILNDPDKALVFDCLKAWLDAHFSA
jgi:alpha-beta hydrolase superfamily lysophospholipase